MPLSIDPSLIISNFLNKLLLLGKCKLNIKFSHLPLNFPFQIWKFHCFYLVFPCFILGLHLQWTNSWYPLWFSYLSWNSGFFIHILNCVIWSIPSSSPSYRLVWGSNSVNSYISSNLLWLDLREINIISTYLVKFFISSLSPVSIEVFTHPDPKKTHILGALLSLPYI